MKKYRISYYINGVKHEYIIKARNYDEAKEIGWEYNDDIYVEEVTE